MPKIAKFLMVLLTVFSLSSVAFADSETPVYIKNADVYNRPADQGIAADVTVCSTNYWRTSFTLKVKNLDVLASYERNLLMPDNGCQDFEIKFNEKFQDITKAGDDLEFSIDDVQAQDSDEKYDEPDSVIETVDEQDDNVSPCGDKCGNTDEYEMCEDDFLIHKDTGIRIKVIDYKHSHKRSYVDLLVSNIEWGGTQELRIYADKEKEVISKDKVRVNIGYLGKSENGALLIQFVTD